MNKVLKVSLIPLLLISVETVAQQPPIINSPPDLKGQLSEHACESIQTQPIVQPPPKLKGGIIEGDQLGSVQLDIIPGVRAKRNLTTGLVAWMEDLPAPPGVNTRREAAEKTIEMYSDLLGVNSDLSNIRFDRELIPVPGNTTSGFIWRQLYNGIEVFGGFKLSIEVRDNLEIMVVSNGFRPIASNPSISFPSDSTPAINAAIRILNAGHILNPEPQAEQRIYLDNGHPRAAWYITFGPQSKIYWWVLVDATTNKPLLADFTGSHRPARRCGKREVLKTN